MVNWKIKGLTQKALSLVPGGARVNTRLQSIVGGMRSFDANLDIKFTDWSYSMDYLSKVNFSVRGKRLVEIGTGWHPSFPILFSLAGADSIATFDIRRYMQMSAAQKLLVGLEARAAKVAEITSNPEADVRARIAELRKAATLDELLRIARIEYIAPGDARATGLKAESVDMVYSNSVFEHIPGEIIREIMTESMRILKTNGIAMHNVSCNDHYAFFDKSVSFVNYLQYDDKQFALWNNSLQYQNRLRAREFTDMAVAAGFRIDFQGTYSMPGTLDGLKKITVAPQFRKFTDEELVQTTVDFIGRKVA